MAQKLVHSFDLPCSGGTLVARIDPKGPAAKAGLQSDITSITAFEKALAGAGGHAALLVKRGDAVLYIALRTD
ncbi:hypothetical protein [Chromobacterium sp. CV08]|uniref:hypothetical protein n=1 Tax=Chromobacterium sp. CV08 TaxID=3133274 RepID=UPI003DA991B8